MVEWRKDVVHTCYGCEMYCPAEYAKKVNRYQAKDAVVTIMNVITSVMVASRMLEFMQRKKVSRNETTGSNRYIENVYY